MKIIRACIYPKDIQCITGRSERYGRKLLNRIKVHFGKDQHQFVTVNEFSECSGNEVDIVNEYMSN